MLFILSTAQYSDPGAENHAGKRLNTSESAFLDEGLNASNLAELNPSLTASASFPRCHCRHDVSF